MPSARAPGFDRSRSAPPGIDRSYSYRAAGSPNPSEVSPLRLYQRLFVDGFQDPNAAEFKPDPRTMARQSVLSAVQEDRRRLMREVGAEDRRRLDEYFSSIRQLEQQLALQLEPPAPVENFTMPKAPSELRSRFRDGQRDGHAPADGGPARQGAPMQPDAGLQRAAVRHGFQPAPRRSRRTHTTR